MTFDLQFSSTRHNEFGTGVESFLKVLKPKITVTFVQLSIPYRFFLPIVLDVMIQLSNHLFCSKHSFIPLLNSWEYSVQSILPPTTCGGQSNRHTVIYCEGAGTSDASRGQNAPEVGPSWCNPYKLTRIIILDSIVERD